MNHRIAIIGAGVAGLTAARELASADIDVKIFEKARGPGGRSSTRRRQTFSFDHGAQYFTVKDSRFRSAVAQFEKNGVVCRWEPSLRTFGVGPSAETGSTERWIGVPGMNALGKALALGLDVEAECRVTNIMREHGLWRLCRGQEQLGVFDALVVTAPCEQAREILEGHLPQKWPLDQVRTDPCWAVLVGFGQPLQLDFEAAFVNDGPISWICSTRSRPGRGRAEGWVIHSTAEWALRHLEEAEESVSRKLLSAFGELITTEVDKPELLQAHRWRYATPEPPLTCKFLWDSDTALGLAGDWCHGSRIEGAYLSGLTLAGRIKQFLESTR